MATFNINGINARLPLLLDWLERDRPDIVCLQELKAPANRFPAKDLAAAGYQSIWHGQKSWNGVAILSRDLPIKERRRSLPGDPDDDQSRYIEADIGGLVVACLYLPNGNPFPGPRFEYKLKWFARLILHARDLLAENRPVMLAGDFNVMPTEKDVYAPERWCNDALFRPEIREAYAFLLKDGWTDAIRTIFPDERIYTFWKYWRNSFERDAGLRIDHFLLNPVLRRRLKGAGVDRLTRAADHPSDHAPVWVTLRSTAPRRRLPVSRAKTRTPPPAKTKTAGRTKHANAR